MKKKYLYIQMIIIFGMILFTNQLMQNKYDINLLQYFKNAKPLTAKEEKWLQDHGPIVFGADQNAPPLRYVDGESGQYKGITIDYLNALSIELGVDIKFVPLLWEEALDSLAKGKTDVCDMFPSEERGKVYQFSDSIYSLRGVILVLKDEEGIKTQGDLEGKRIAIPKGDYGIEYLNENVPAINYFFARDIHHAIELLLEGKVEAVVGDEPVISYFIDKMNVKDNVKIIDPPIYENDVIFAVPKVEKTLLNILNKGIFNLKKKNVLEKVQQKWLGISAPISKVRLSDRITMIIGLLVILFSLAFYFFYSWNNTLKEEVKRRTEELDISRNDLQTTFDGLTHFMIVINQGYRIVNVNQSFCNYVGRAKEDIIGVQCIGFPGLLSDEDGTLLFKEFFMNGTEGYREVAYEDKVFEMNAFPLEDKNKKAIKMLLVMKDITDLKVHERQLLQANKMAAVGQLAAGVAHEIRNPLGLIRTYSYMLKMKLQHNDEKIQKSIQGIDDSLERASNIIDNLLNFSRISGEKWELISIYEMIENILKLENKTMEKLNIKGELLCDENLLFYGNQESLKHILINLVSNAIDAMPEGGRLEIICEKKNNGLLMTCGDTGMGIEKKDLDNIFNPFFTTKAPGKGTGLGLYITYSEVQKFGGRIETRSEIGKGTTFEIFLPFKREEE